MKLNLNSSYPHYSRHYVLKHNGGELETPKFDLKKESNDISFTSAEKFSKIISKKTGEVVYTNASAIIDNIDKIFGEGFFTQLLQKAKINPSGNELRIKSIGLFRRLIDTTKQSGVKKGLSLIGDSVLDFPAKVSVKLLKGLNKISPLKNLTNMALTSKFIKNKMAKFEFRKNYSLLNEILDEFTSKKLALNSGDKLKKVFSLSNCTAYLKNKASDGITKGIKNYSSRDERTINRLATGIVSSIYGGWDFYNLSMVQKDNKKEAKKAQKERFSVELKKYATSAGFTFLTLGALNKYIKDSMVLNVAAIIGSSIISEIFSKVTSGTPIIPLTPEKARIIAQKRKLKENQDKPFNKEVAKNILLKGHKELIPKERQIFGNFISKDGSFASLKALNNLYSPAQETAQKKKSKAGKIIGISVGIASAAYLIASFLKGEFALKKDIKSIYDKNADKINEFLSGETEKLDEGVLKQIVDKIKAQKVKADKIDIFSKIRRVITTKSEEIKLEELGELKNKLIGLSESNEGKGIKDVLAKYIKDIDGVIADGKPFKIEKERKLASGFYNGLTKIAKTIYQILSLPGLGIKTLYNAANYKQSNAALDKIKAITGIGTDVKKEISGLRDIISKNNDDNKIVKNIQKKIKRLSIGPETGELANYARTCVTFISSMFFINDYRNKVLIESEGKDTKKASEEVGTRIAQKGFNFVINGTLMNLFNSIFKVPLNKSLIGAAWVPALTEVTNETLTRKFIFQPILPKNSKQEIIDFEAEQNSKQGIAGWWNKTYKRLTNKKSITEKAGIKNK